MKSRLDQSTTTAIQQLLEHFLATWNAKDLDGFMETFHEDAEFTDVVGQTALGREAIRTQHAFAFGVVMKAATFEMSNLMLRPIVAGAVLATANWLNQGSQTPDGKPLPDRHGVIQLVLTENPAGQWKFKLVHNADFSLPYASRKRIIQ